MFLDLSIVCPIWISTKKSVYDYANIFHFEFTEKIIVSVSVPHHTCVASTVDMKSRKPYLYLYILK